MSVEIGQQAPDFELKDQEGNAISLSGLRDKKAVALVFYPFTFTSVCEGELCQLRDDISDFEAAGRASARRVLRHRHAQRVWAEQKGYTFPVLSDFWPHGEVARAYGVFNEALGCANRATFLISKDGVVIDTFATDSLGTPREKSRYKQAIARL